MGHDKIGPREQALREMRETKWAEQQRAARAVTKLTVHELKDKVAIAAKKTGKSLKRRKK